LGQELVRQWEVVAVDTIVAVKQPAAETGLQMMQRVARSGLLEVDRHLLSEVATLVIATLFGAAS
jgi:hypothetical protein